MVVRDMHWTVVLTAIYRQFTVTTDKDLRSVLLFAYLSVLAHGLRDYSATSTVRKAARDCIRRNQDFVSDPQLKSLLVGLCLNF